MRDYTFFISQFTCICYVIAYSSFFYFRRRKGVITAPMLNYASRHWYIFASVGLLEAVNFLLALHSAARLPGGLISVLSQTGILWSVLLSYALLRRRFDWRQLLGVFIVAAGVTTCTLPQAAAAGLAVGASRELLTNTLLFLASTGCGALTSILKEWAFSRADLDIFVVNTLGSTAQCFFTLALLPVSLALATTLPAGEYLRRGWAAFWGATHPSMPWLAIAYILANLTVNISALTLVKRGGAVSATVAGVPLTPTPTPTPTYYETTLTSHHTQCPNLPATCRSPPVSPPTPPPLLLRSPLPSHNRSCSLCQRPAADQPRAAIECSRGAEGEPTHRRRRTVTTTTVLRSALRAASSRLSRARRCGLPPPASGGAACARPACIGRSGI